MQHDEVIPILNFGSQYAQLIARRVRKDCLPPRVTHFIAPHAVTLRVVARVNRGNGYRGRSQL